MSSSSSSPTTTTTTGAETAVAAAAVGVWIANDPEQAAIAKEQLEVWPLDENNAKLLNEVHPYGYTQSTPDVHPVYDLIAIGAGAGGLVSAKQSARRGARSAMISERLAGGDCLNVGCVPSKALLHAAKTINVVRSNHNKYLASTTAEDEGPGDVKFESIMERMRFLRSSISPADGHKATVGTSAHVFQGRGIFTSPNTIKVVRKEVDGTVTTIVPELQFKKAVIATGGSPTIPSNIPGLAGAPYTTNESIFNLQTLPERMIVLGAGVVALEMAYCFATFGSKVTVINRSERLFGSKDGDVEASQIIQDELEQIGVTFLHGTSVQQVTTIRERNESDTTQHPLLQVTVVGSASSGTSTTVLECETLLVATGRTANVEQLGLEDANVEYKVHEGIVINDLAQSVTNPNVYAVGDCVAGVPRLTHVSGEMAKLIIQNSLFHDQWKLSSFVIPSVMYTDPEYATVGISSKAMATKKGIDVDVYRCGLEDNDRAILDENPIGYCSIVCAKGTDTILGCTIVSERAGEMINEVTLAMKNNIGLRAIGRNIHSYPTLGEGVMGCGIVYINANAERIVQ